MTALSRRDQAEPALIEVRTGYPSGARAFDLALTVLLLPLALPIATLVGMAVALDSPGPVLYTSVRVGRDGRRFRMVKFRTMIHEAKGPRITRGDDVRYTPVGRLIAAARLDELPQLWNVLRGQMRLVGPRPELEEFVLDQAPSYRRILSLPPGITGPTQLAFADEGRVLARSPDPESLYRQELLPRKVELDLEYVETNSRGGDLRLLMRTWTVPIRMFSRALGESSERTRRRAALVVAQVVLLTAAAVAMVAMFAVEGSAAI